MNTSRTTIRYEVMGLVPEPDGSEDPVMRAVHCGASGSIEEAFDLALELAVAQWRAIATAAALDASGGIDCSVIVTEWGYDIVHGRALVARFLVQDPFADEARAA